MTNTALIIFIRNPELGKVKTRLARDLGETKALDIYKALLSQTRNTALAVETQRLLFYSEKVQENDGWPEESFHKLLQHGDDLGERMQHAFGRALEDADKAVIVGSDIAQIKPAIIDNAFRALDEADYVIGPALDGGYYLLGMKQATPELFQHMEWSNERVADETKHRIQQLGRSYLEVDTLSDIDYAADWEKYGWPI